VPPEGRRLDVNEAEAHTVRWIFERFLQIGSATKLMQELNAQGITTKRWMTRTGRMAGGARWNKMHIYRLLNNRVYVGDVHHKGVYYPGEHQPIVDGELYDRVQVILAENHRARGNRTRHETPALLRGIIRCCHCDSAMGPTYTRKKGRVYRYYHCIKATKNGRETCPVRTIAAGEVEQAVIGQVRALFRSPEMIADTWREARRIQSEAPGDWPAEGFTEQEIAEALGRLDDVWECLFPGEQERLIRLMVERLDVSPDGIDLRLRADGLTGVVDTFRAREAQPQ